MPDSDFEPYYIEGRPANELAKRERARSEQEPVVKCGMCKGTGYRGPNSRPDAPYFFKIGCWPCEFCQGKGTQSVIL